MNRYDYPYTRCYAEDKAQARKILRMLQGFYSTLKGEYKNIHLCFVTGITRLALSEFFSAFNAAVDLTMNPDYAAIVGFTENELRQYFGNFIKNVATVRKTKEEDIIETIKELV